ncbi:MAG: sugar ABC transporter ATP-binding protein [Thermoprotei archaeon]|nr:MAG: sugar ABC transporter ATP-binding protein [Thermoprotei archaeon]
MVSVKLVNLSKYFGKVRAVDDLNLEIKDREFVALLGPSGCGKTTTLLMIAGIYKPTKGYIYFDERVVNDLPPKERNVGMVFQTYALYPHMSVYDNIAFPLKLKKVPKSEIDRKVKEVARFLRIEELLNRKPSQLSGGQQQRVALARALAKEPQLFLMDEPLSNLDAKLRVTMRAELKKLQKELGITTIYVTHDQVEAMTMADRIAVLNEGRLQQYGNPHDLYNRPANLFVAGFIGSPPMNFLDGSVVEKEGEMYLDFGAFTLKLPEGVASVLRSRGAPSEVVFGIRPEDVVIGEGGIEGEVYVVEPLGRDAIVHVNVGGGMRIRAMVPAGTPISMGGKIRISFNMERMHLFDKKSGEAYV